MKSSYRKRTLNETVIFIHGNSSDSTVFNGILNNPTFQYCSYTLSLPGHYEEDSAVQLNDFSITAIINQITEFVSSINYPILLFGHSLGGHLAIEIAPKLNNLKGLCVMGTPPIELPINFESAFNPVVEMSVLFEEAPTDNLLDAFLKKAVVNPTVKDSIKANFVKTHPKARGYIANAIPKNEWSNQRAIFRDLQIPKYIAHGLKDPFINLDYLEEIKTENQPKCSLTLFMESGHYPMLETPKDFEEYVVKICNKSFGT